MSTTDSPSLVPPSPPLVKFSPPRSTAEPSFWMELGKLKLNELRLSEDPVSIVARMGVEGRRDATSTGTTDATPTGTAADAAATASSMDALPPRVRLDAESISSIGSIDFVRNETMYVPSSITCLNTIESFKQVNKNDWLDSCSLNDILRACGLKSADNDDAEEELNMVEEEEEEEEEEDDLSPLLTSACLCHLDLKKHVYLHWFAFPALLPRKGRAVRYAGSLDDIIGPGGSSSGGDSPSPSPSPGQSLLMHEWGADAVRKLRGEYSRLRMQRLRETGSADTSTSRRSTLGCPPFFLIVRRGSEASSPDTSVQCFELSKYNYERLSEEERETVAFGFLDPTCAGGDITTSADGYVPVGWPLRNLIAYLALRLELAGRVVSVVSYRPAILRRIDPSKVDDSQADSSVEEGASDAAGEEDRSLLLRIELPAKEDYDWSIEYDDAIAAASDSPRRPLYKTTGFESNARGRPGPRTVNLSPLLSPQHLSAQASDLNLRLMKWRAVPSLDLDLLGSLRVLLLGAGTLGCSVSRTLQGWGIRDMTLVDNGRVSYSNPVRQNLFVLTDCMEGGKMKAVAAAGALKRVAGEENMKSRGVALTIPMPGHPFGTEKAEAKAKEDTEKLSALVKECDVVFLLTDTRESRWLPTVMARAEGKMLINAALGLDSWLVMRHGGEKIQGKGDRLGCYFCNDVVAPENSTNNRTLDQQCTVTRPGLAPIASSMAAELMVSLLHHPLGHAAPAPRPVGSGEATDYRPVVAESAERGDGGGEASPLGLMPHQIRGSIASYTMMTPTVPAFAHCTGCSDNIINHYKDRGFDFVREACNSLDGSYLEDLSGLSESRREAERMMEAAMEDWDDDSDEMDV